MRRETIKATACGAAVTALLAVAIVVGSRRLSHFDAALVGYTFATLFAAFGIAYRYAMWLQRPPTAMYWKRGWQVFFRPPLLLRNLTLGCRRVVSIFFLNSFIWKRGLERGAAHWLIMWGCVLAAAITFPLSFGWIHFETAAGDFGRYEAHVFGFLLFSFRIHSWIGFLIFHGLVWSAVLVTTGVMLAMQRRMRDRDAATLQRFGEDLLPLVLLFAISVTGLMLVVSYQWMYGYAYDFLAILHAAVVIFTLLWLPFGKFFHIFQRPAQLGVLLYKDAAARGEQAKCRRCGDAYAPQMQIEDLIHVEKSVGYNYDLATSEQHYQWICPRCRRAMLGIVQGQLWRDAVSVARTTNF
ncbi:MAG: MFS transporter [Pirellulales bacterium]|nr:MFS transporter [Pirellulales bacterium]